MPNKVIKPGYVENIVSVVLQSTMSALLPLTVIAAIYLSYFFELSIYRSLFRDIDFNLFAGFTVTMLVAVTTNAAKLGITWILAHKKQAGEPTVWGSALRAVLIGNSLLMTVFIVNGLFTAPNAQQVYANKKTEIQASYYERGKTVERNHEKVMYQLNSSYELEVKRIRELYQPDLDKAEAGMATEMVNVQNSVWKGSRYNEWKEKYDTAKEKMDLALVQAMNRYQQSIAKQNARFEQQQRVVATEKQTALASESIEKYLNSYESQNRYVISLIDLIHQLSGKSAVAACHISLLVALLMCTIVEFTPLLLGAHLFSRILSMQIEKKPEAWGNLTVLQRKAGRTREPYEKVANTDH